MSSETVSYFSHPFPRRQSVGVSVGGVIVGGSEPVVVQSMTNTDTADIDGTVAQVAALHRAGSEIVRITVDRDESAAAVPKIRERLERLGMNVPLVGDFHYIGHKLLADHPACAEALAKYRINPGNVGFKDKKDKQFADIVEMAIRYDKPVRIGVNWGSLDQDLLTTLMDRNQAEGAPLSAQEVMREAIVQSALISANLAEEIGLSRDKIILSAKVSQVQDLIAVYTMLAQRSNHALHLGLTEAGMGTKGVVASSAAMGILLQQGIGDTIRISLTPEPGGDRTREVQVAQELLQTMGFRQFIPIVAACPGCGRTTSTVFQELAQNIQDDIRRNMPVWREKYPGSKRFRSRLWDVSSMVRANRNMPILASRFPVRAKRRPHQSLSMARRSRRCVVLRLLLTSRRWLPNISKTASGLIGRSPLARTDFSLRHFSLRHFSLRQGA